MIPEKIRADLVSKIISVLLTLFCTSSVFASDVSIGATNYEYSTFVDGFRLDFDAIGVAVGANLAISDNSFLQAGYSSVSDDQNLMAGNIAEFDSDSWHIGLAYNINKWQIFGRYSSIEDEIELVHGQQNDLFSSAKIDWQRFDFSGSYSGEQGLWAYTLTSGLQYDHSDVEGQIPPLGNIQTSETDSWYANVSVGADYYFALTDDSGAYAGISFNWFEQISSDDSNSVLFNNGMGGMPPPPPRPGGGSGSGGRGNGGGANSTFGESYGLLGFYLIYTINSHWSLDWNTYLGVKGDENSNSHALTLSYFF
ncbi:MAG: hypothetical protein GKR93_10905 [Gammaproteobacteria bacterium]|nr:hypothetical protein [Gammaproteobacteria bacterium]